MRKTLLYVCFSLVVLNSFVKTDEPWCEFFNVWPWTFSGSQKTCRVPTKKSITSPETTLSLPQDGTVRGIEFFGNNNISVLPIRISESFPNLLGFGAGNCSIKVIKKENFQGLRQLKELLLFENFIEKITRDVFEDLVSLEFINLDSNKITSINSNSLSNLRSLKKVWLNFNTCININFEGEAQINAMSTVLTEKCGSSSVSQASVSCSPSNFSSYVDKLRTELEATKAKNVQLAEEKLQCQKQVKQILDLQALWEMRWDATYTAKTGELLEELKKRKAVIDEKDRRIRVLERQIEALKID